jgi:hypothetical protein
MTWRVLVHGAAAALAGLIGAGSAAAAEAETFQDLKLPTPASVWEIEGGYRWDRVAGRASDGYYRIGYRGSPILLKGTPTQYTQHIGLDQPKPPADADRSDWSFTYEHGKVASGGGLLQGEMLTPLDLNLPKQFQPRGTAFVGGDATFKQVNVAVGLETPPQHLGVLSRAGISHWAVVGLGVQHREQTDAAEGDKNFVAATYRLFLGKAFGWRRKASVDMLAARIGDAYLREAPTLAIAEGVDKNLAEMKAKKVKLTRFQEAFRDAYDDAKGKAPEEWEGLARKAARGAAEAISEQPTVAVYAEVSGWYEMRGADDTARSRALFTLTTDYWFLPSRDDVFLRLRYENGYERGNPQARKNQILASVALRF